MPNGEPDSTDPKQEVTFEDFKIYADNNPGSENADFYEAFPTKPRSTLRRWKMEYLKDSTPPPSPPSPSPKKETIPNETLIANNKTLMRGTSFSDKNFEGMSPLQINRFLINYHNQKSKQKPEEEPNSPIIGTPVGSGKPKMYLDDFLTIDPKRKTIDFEAPGSVVFGQFKNRKEAENRWVQP